MADNKEGRDYVEKSSVEQTIKSTKNIEAGEAVMAPTVQSTTESTPAEADKSPLPNAMDAKPEQPPVRAAKPDTPIAQTLAAGAGEHTPPDPKMFAPSGRPRDVEEA
jgi:hypothetical protein